MTRTISFPSKKDLSLDIIELDTRLTNLEQNETIYQVFQSTGTNQTGTVTIPTGAEIFDYYNDGVSDEIVVKADTNNNPLEEVVKTSSGVTVFVSSFDILGNYTLSGVPATNACIIYFLKIKDVDKSNIPENTIVEVIGDDPLIYATKEELAVVTPYSVGLIDPIVPTFVDNGNGTATFAACNVALYDNVTDARTL